MSEATLPWSDDPLWYKDAIIYQLHVKAFFDSNDDGIGDFKGLVQKLDYIQDLGVNTLWLLPFYPSPMRDDGYDISDYRSIHPDYGSRADFRLFMREAHARGLRVITELVINHTSDQHPWFQAARRAPRDSNKHNFYVWSDTDKKFPETRIIFTDTETSNWAWDPVAQRYYWHRFFSHQPDLNHNNPRVVEAVIHILRFWLEMGVDGVRLDAIPYLCVREGTSNENLPETHAVLRQMRAAVDAHYKNRMFLAEANQWPEDVRDYFGEANECHMAYHFPLMPRMYMAVAQEDRHPIVEIMNQTPDIPETCQWAIFLRNHDELTLEMVTDKERDYMYQVYASDRRMRLNVGIRRRLAPLMDNDVDKIKLMNSLLMSMPGSPIIYYGDEIGMGDNIFLGDRNGVRTPMQWSLDRNAGFSRADPQRLYLPPIMDPIYGYQAVNVEAQSRDQSSLLHWMKRLLAVRKSSQCFGRGKLSFLRPGNRKILAFLRCHGDEVILCVANLSRSAQPVELDLHSYKGYVPVEMLGRTAFPPIGELPYMLTVTGYGVYWFRLTKQEAVPRWHQEMLPSIELATLVLPAGLRSFIAEDVDNTRRAAAIKLRTQLETEVLPAYLRNQRWFAAKGEKLQGVSVIQQAIWTREGHSWLVAVTEVDTGANGKQRYFLPLTLRWGESEDAASTLGPCILSRVRQQSRIGILCDAFGESAFSAALVHAMDEGSRFAISGGQLHFTATAAYKSVVRELPADLEVRRPAHESSNTALILGERLFLKAYRRIRAGISPEWEMGRFLTEVSPFPHITPVYGALEYQADDGERSTLALLQGYVDNQGDAWSHTIGYAQRFLQRRLVSPYSSPVSGEMDEAAATETLLMNKLGQRTGELHRALSMSTNDPAFNPEPVTPEDLHQWTARLEAELGETLRLLQSTSAMDEPTRALAQQFTDRAHDFTSRIHTLLPDQLTALKTRHHGDYHLGQVLVAQNDVIITDFEGEPARSLDERRAKHTALRDVAGMLRSLNYAAHVALRTVTAERPDDFKIAEPFAQEWEQRAAQTFLSSYVAAVGDCGVYPAAPGAGATVINFMALAKALYEVRYELNNRPDWVHIPLLGALRLM